MVAQTCNLACRYCYGSGGTYGSAVKLMDERSGLAAIDIMLRRAPQKRSFSVTFFGGEPLLNFNLIRTIVEHCEKKATESGVRFSYSMTTNGTVLTQKILDFLKRNRFTLMISFDGRGHHDRLRPFREGKGSESVVKQNIAKLTAAGLPVQLRATLVRETANPDALGDLVAFGRSVGCRKIVTSPRAMTTAKVTGPGLGIPLGFYWSFAPCRKNR